jgi:predicted amidophosphoribosyltransferase
MPRCRKCNAKISRDSASGLCRNCVKPMRNHSPKLSVSRYYVKSVCREKRLLAAAVGD